MSYAGHANLISLQLADSSAKVDSRLTRMLATSLVVHAVLLLGFMSVRFAPTLQQPLASYYVDLVTLPEPHVAPPSKKSTTSKSVSVLPPVKKQVKPLAPVQPVSKTPPPPKPEVVPSPVPSPAAPMVEPIQTEQITPSIVDAVDRVALPQSRQMAPIKMAASVTQSPTSAMRTNESQAISMPAVPQAPQLSNKKIVPDYPTPKTSTPSTRSLAETLKQAVQSVAVPHKPQLSNVPTLPTQPKTKPISSTGQSQEDTSPKISTPGRAPQMAKVIPRPNPIERQQNLPQRNQVADSVKEVLQSVVVPKVRKSQVSPGKKLQAVPVPIPPSRDTQSKPRQKLSGMVIPSDAPTLATVNVKKALTKKTIEGPPSEAQPDAMNPNIAKLVIPNVQVPDTQHILSKPIENGVQQTTTTLQVSGSSSEGNAYWGRVWSKIDREWIAPQVGIRSGRPLQVVLAFRIERDGGVKNLAIEQSSGNEYYDIAAKRAILDAAPLPPFGADMPEAFYNIQFQFTVNVDS